MVATRLLTLSCVLALGACGSDGSETTEDTDAAGSSSSSDPSGSPTGDDASQTSADPSGNESDGSTSSVDPTSGPDETSGDPSGTDDPTDPTDDPTGDPGGPQIPELQGDCPEFVAGGINNPALLEFPVGSGSRQALVYFDPAQGGGGPLILFYHGGGGDPDDAVATVTDDVILEVLAEGGMVIAPVPDPAANLEWFLASGSAQNDVVMMDSLVACADAGPGIDIERIHGIGFSAGALHVSISSLLRSSYIASTVVYSGGIYTNFNNDNPDVAPSSLIFHGGPSDDVGGLPFQQSSQLYANTIEERGGYPLVCNHNTGHGYPDNIQGEWRRPDAYNFLRDHPWGVTPHPYPASGLPDWVPPYCEG